MSRPSGSSSKGHTQHQLEALLRQYKIRPNREHGQNFLADGTILRRELEYAQLNPSDVVLEIGPGIGLLTEALAQRAHQVIAIERDRQFHRRLTDLAARYPNLKILWGDAALLPLPPFTKAVANLPFKISLPLTFKLLERRFERAVFIYQKRQAQRLCAQVGEPGYSRIGIVAAQKARLEYLETVPRNAFRPQPKVDCALISIERTRPRFSVPSDEFFRLVLEALFESRQATIEEALLTNPPNGLNHASIAKALAPLKGKIKKRVVFQATPKQLGEISWALWRAKGSAAKGSRRE